MQIQDTQSYMSLLNLRQAYADQASPKAAQETAPQTVGAAATVKAANDTITGTTASTLSPRVVEQLMQVAQQAAQTETAPDTPLRNWEQRHLERIANDPDYAAEQAEMLGMHGELLLIDADSFPQNGAPASEWAAFFQATEARMAQVNQVTQERRELYQRLVGQGTPPAEIYAQLLEFNANQPPSYDAMVGTSQTNGGVSYSEWHGERRAYLQQAMTRTAETHSG